MRRLFSSLILLCLIVATARAEGISGSGSTLIHPVMVQWIKAYAGSGGAPIEYQPVGSAGGLSDVRNDLVDFAVSEAPLESEQLLRDGLTQFPMVFGAIVPVVHIDGITPGQLHFTGSLLADIFLGRIKKWNDPAIVALNPDANLPALAIYIIHRSDGSGSTFVWTDYLSKVSPDWKVRVGASTKVAWPTGAGGDGNRGVAEKVGLVRGAIGYVDFTYAVRANLSYGLVRNQAGRFVMPDAKSFEAAVASVDWTRDPDFDVLLTDPPAPDAYPIMATSFVLMRKTPKDPARAKQMVGFFTWAMENGTELANSLNYSPLPRPLIAQIRGYWEAQKP
jgi:phosphate transport system substrate-binding protein